MHRSSIYLLASLLLLAGCSSRDNGRYHIKQDKPPAVAPDLSHVQNATPRYEPYSKQGNKDYEVWGQAYQVMPDANGFTQQGTASWYGEKFHGHLTSNGETYNMYGMSAAHKTLPLPSYVRVTNLNNNKSVIVRVNDRGPFHSSRIIDVSYAAAYKLGMLQTGTAPVRIEVIMTDSPESRAIAEATSNQPNLPTTLSNAGASADIVQSAVTQTAPSTPPSSNTAEVTDVAPTTYYIQVFASSSEQRVKAMTATLEQKFSLQSRISFSDSIYRLQLGPIGNEDIAIKMLDRIRHQGYGKSFMIRENITNLQPSE